MDVYKVAFIGHREIPNIISIQNELERIAKELIRTKEFVEFYVGRNGDFDISVASAVKFAQKTLGRENSSLILVLPYSTKDIEYYEKFYDEIIIPVTAHFKAAITERNKWLIDHSDLLVGYVEKDKKGGAQTALKYAESQGTKIVNLTSAINYGIFTANITCLYSEQQ